MQKDVQNVLKEELPRTEINYKDDSHTGEDET